MALLQGAAKIVNQEMLILVQRRPNYLVESKKNVEGLSFKVTMDLLEHCDVFLQFAYLRGCWSLQHRFTISLRQIF